MRPTNIPIIPLNTLRRPCPRLSGVEWQGAGDTRGLILLKSLEDFIASAVVERTVKVTTILNVTKQSFKVCSKAKQQLKPQPVMPITNTLRSVNGAPTIQSLKAGCDSYLQTRREIFRIEARYAVMNPMPAWPSVSSWC